MATTPNYSFTLPTVGGSSGVWGTNLNANWTSTDSLLSGGTPVAGIDINSGSIDGTAIGAASASTGAFTSVAVDNITIDGQQITSTNTNGNIQLFANGTGYIEVYGNTNAGAIRFNCESNSHGVTLKGPPHSAAATYSLELPNADASGFLQSDGSGKLSFGSPAAGLPTPTIQATGVTATSGQFLVVTNGGITITLPASPAAGNYVIVKDGTGGAATTSFTVARNGSKIASAESDLTFDKNFAEITMTYIDATIGWSV